MSLVYEVWFQVCAAVTSPDTFIIRVLHRFGLRVWAETNFEEIRAAFNNVASDDLSKCTVTLAEEMLHLLIIIIGYFFYSCDVNKFNKFPFMLPSIISYFFPHISDSLTDLRSVIILKGLVLIFFLLRHLILSSISVKHS